MMTRLIIILLLWSATNAFSQTDTLVIKTDVQCEECRSAIISALNFEKGVKHSDVDVARDEITIVYNASKTDPDRLRKAVASTGYDADSIPADMKAYQRLKPCCKKGGHE
jgi:periplasmic mercuric ion binding protein